MMVVVNITCDIDLLPTYISICTMESLLCTGTAVLRCKNSSLFERGGAGT